MTEYSIESGIVAYQQGDKAQAAVIFTALVKQDPNHADAWFWLGRSLDNPERSRYCFERAASLNPFLSTRSYIYEDPEDKPRSKPAENPPARPTAPPLIPASIYSPLPAFNPDPLPAPAAPQPVTPPPPPPPPSPFYALEPAQVSSEASGQQDASGNERTNLQRSDKILIGLIAALISFLALATPGFLLIRGGAIDARLQPELFKPQSAAPVSSPTVSALQEPSPTPTARPTATLTPTLSSDAEINGILDQVYTLEDQEEYEKAIEVLNKAIRKYPRYDHFYNLRAYNYGQLTTGLQNQSEYLTYLHQAIADQEKAISLPHSEMFFWTYYGNLANYYDDLANEMVLRSEADAYNLISYQNHLLAFDNGGDIHTLLGAARDLNEMGRWDEAAIILDEIKQNSSAFSSDYYDIEAEILRSQKKYKESIALMEQYGSGCAVDYTRSLVQYEAGLKSDAFESINTCITNSPNSGGYRYFFRALIHLDRKEYDLARQDLTSGEGVTWAVHGLHDYVLARLLIKDGDQENGRYYLQMAEASMPYQMGPILDRVRKEMKQLRVDPLTPQPSIESLPTVQPTAGIRLTPRPTTQATEVTQDEPGGSDSNIASPDPFAPKELPTDHFYYIVVDPNQPLIQKKILASGSLDLHFQLPDDLDFTSIDSFTLIFTPRYTSQTVQLQIKYWIPREGWSDIPAVGWGETVIENPSRMITSDGDFYISIYNSDDRAVAMQNMQFTIQAQLSDGSTLVMEAQP